MDDKILSALEWNAKDLPSLAFTWIFTTNTLESYGHHVPGSPLHTQNAQPYLLTLRSPCLTSSHSDLPALPPHTQIPQPFLFTLRSPSLTSSHSDPQPYLLALRSLSLTSSHTKLSVSSPHSQRATKNSNIFYITSHECHTVSYRSKEITRNIFYLMIEILSLYHFFYFVYMFICFSNAPYTVKYLGHQN